MAGAAGTAGWAGMGACLLLPWAFGVLGLTRGEIQFQPGRTCCPGRAGQGQPLQSNAPDLEAAAGTSRPRPGAARVGAKVAYQGAVV